MNFKKLFNLTLPLLLLSSAVVGMAIQPSYQDFVNALNLFRGRQDAANASKLISAYSNLNPGNQKRANQAAAVDLTKAQALLSPTRQPQVDQQAEAQRIAQEQAAQAEAQKIAAAQAEAQRIAQQKAADAKRLADAQAAAEKAARDAAEAKRIADAKAAKDAADAQALAEKAARDAAEAKRLADEKAARDAAEAKRLADLDILIDSFPKLESYKLLPQINLVLKNHGNEALTRKVAVALQTAINSKSTDPRFAELIKAFNAKLDTIKEYDLSNLKIVIASPAVTLLTLNELMPALKDNNRFDTEAKAIKHLTSIRASIEELKKSGPVDPGIIATYNNKLNFLSKSKKFNNLPLPIN